MNKGIVTYALLLALLIGCKPSDDVVPTDEDDATERVGTHEEAGDYTIDSTTVTRLTLNGASIAVSGSGASVSGSTVTITAAGTYRVAGTLTNGQLRVNAADAVVKIILSGATITHASNAPVFIESAKKAIVYLAPNTKNTLADGATYAPANADDEPNAALFSKADLTLFGAGTLTVTGQYNDGISSKDGLIVQSGTYVVNAKDDGLRGKDYLIVRNGTFTVTAGGDGLKSDHETSTSLGYVTIDNGQFTITSTADGIQAETDLKIAAGTFNLTTGGGSTRTVSGDASAKGLKAGIGLTLGGGTFGINSADDGLHADASLTVNGGDVTITKSYEGVESAVIRLNHGTIRLTSTDDGLNAASSTASRFLTVKGGYLLINAGGDGVDVNGSAEMSGGTVLVNGPTTNGNAALDYDGTFKITGGYFVAAGSSGMAQIPGTASTQPSVLLTFGTAQKAGSLAHLQTPDGQDVLTFSPAKAYQSIAFSSPALKIGSTYDVYLGGTSTGTATDGLYRNATYAGGTKSTSVTLSSVATRVTVR